MEHKANSHSINNFQIGATSVISIKVQNRFEL